MPEPPTKTTADAYAETELVGTDVARTDASTTQTAVGTLPMGGDAPPASTIGRFRLEAMLGSGGMGDVHRAYDPVLDRTVALKVVRSGGRDDRRLRRVLREARAAAALTHPNTVTIFEVGEADGEVFLAMELLSGEVLRVAAEKPGVGLELKLRWLLQAARALQAAHERGLVHRDVKPDNMFVCSDGTLKLLDFGIAKRDEADEEESGADSIGPSSLRTAEGRRVGTPRYMAPEQHAGQPTDARTDEYAWGLVAFELLTKLHPGVHQATAPAFASGGAPDRSSVARARQTGLQAAVPELAEPVAAAIARALEPRKEDRFPSMDPIVLVLEANEARAGANASSSLPPPLTSTRPSAARSRVAAIVAGVGVLLVGGAMALRAVVAMPGKSADPASARPACHVTMRPAVALAPKDRHAVLPTGEAVVTRDITQGITLTRETPAGPVAFTRNDLSNNMLRGLGSAHRNVQIHGFRLAGEPWVLVDVDQGHESGVLLCALSATKFSAQRVFPPVTGVAFDVADRNIVYGVTTLRAEQRSGNLPSGAELYLIRGTTAETMSVEAGGAYGPAVAFAGDRIAFAYLFDPGNGASAEIHLAILDGGMQRLGDVHTIGTKGKRPLPALAFSGSTATVFWIDESGTKTRLTSVSYSVGDRSPGPSRVAIDEATTVERPVTARLPDGQWVIAWSSMVGGSSHIRVSSIGADGHLLGATDVATVGAHEELRATGGDHGVELTWRETVTSDTRSAQFAHVTCGGR